MNVKSEKARAFIATIKMRYLHDRDRSDIESEEWYSVPLAAHSTLYITVYAGRCDGVIAYISAREVYRDMIWRIGDREDLAPEGLDTGRSSWAFDYTALQHGFDYAADWLEDVLIQYNKTKVNA